MMTPLYTQMLSISEYGIYNNYLSWQSLLIAVATLNLSSTVNNAYIDYEKEKFIDYISSISLFSIIVPTICMITFCVAGGFSTSFDLPERYVWVLYIAVIFSSALTIFQTEERAKSEYKISSILTLCVAVGTFFLTGLLLAVKDNKLSAAIYGGTISTIAVNVAIYGYIFYRSHVVRWEYIRYSLVIVLPLMPHILSGVILGSSDKILITKFCGPEETAIYSLVFVVSMVVTMVASSINQAWVPWFMEKLSRNKADEIKQATKPYTFVVVIGGILIGLAAPEIIMIIGGEEYLEAVDLIPVIVLKCILAFFYTLYVNIEFYLKKTALISMITVLVSCVGLTISYISIPLWGYTAAAYGALISSGLELLLHAMCVKRLGMSCIYDNAFIAKMVVVACISCVFILSIYQHSFIRQILLIVLVFIFFQRCRFVMDMR